MGTSKKRPPARARGESAKRERKTPAQSARRERKASASARRAGGAYHHGDLRRALLTATEELLEAEGLEGFTLREVARRAGVSHGAPAHHFGDVRGLLSEFTAQSFEQLSATMRRRRARASDDAFDQLTASGIGYVEYALTHRARFQLMFRTGMLDLERASLVEAAGDAFGQLVECIRRVARDAGASPELDSDKIALAWSIVHGFATLMIDNRNFAERVSGGSRTRALETVERLIVSSRAAFERRA